MASPFATRGVCRICGCTFSNPCYHPVHGYCWWADDARTICSHCADPEIAGDARTVHCVNSKPRTVAERNVCTVNFNTPELTRAAIRSLWKHTPGCRVTVFDNSDRRPFGSMDGVRVIDNTRGQVIDFDALLQQVPAKADSGNNWGSAKHCRTIQELFSFFPDGFVLIDSDILIKQDISVFFDPDRIYVGEENITPYRHRHKIPRLLPFLCWINVEMCRQRGIGYYDPDRCWMLHPAGRIQSWYDTGASFLEDCRISGAPAKSLRLDDYILHLKGASWTGRQHSAGEWLEQHRDLYE